MSPASENTGSLLQPQTHNRQAKPATPQDADECLSSSLFYAFHSILRLMSRLRQDEETPLPTCCRRCCHVRLFCRGHNQPAHGARHAIYANSATDEARYMTYRRWESFPPAERYAPAPPRHHAATCIRRRGLICRREFYFRHATPSDVHESYDDEMSCQRQMPLIHE